MGILARVRINARRGRAEGRRLNVQLLVKHAFQGKGVSAMLVRNHAGGYAFR